MNDSNFDFYLEEYRQVRENIRLLCKGIGQFSLTAIIASISLISAISIFIFKPEFNIKGQLYFIPVLFFLFPPLILINILKILSSHRRDIHRMGSYLQIIVEETNFNMLGWESHVNKLRKEIMHDNKYLRGESFDFIPWLFWVIFGVSVLLALTYVLFNIKLFTSNYIQCLIFIIFILGVLLEYIYLRKFHKEFKYFSDGIRKEYLKIWKQIISEKGKV